MAANVGPHSEIPKEFQGYRGNIYLKIQGPGAERYIFLPNPTPSDLRDKRISKGPVSSGGGRGKG